MGSGVVEDEINTRRETVRSKGNSPDKSTNQKRSE